LAEQDAVATTAILHLMLFYCTDRVNSVTDMWIMQLEKLHVKYLTHLYGHLPNDADHAAQNGTNVGELKIDLRIKDDFRNRIFSIKRGVVPFHR
jgi:hypothetical protein